MRRPRHHRNGFTLLEVMLVLGVIAMFLAMTLPSVLRIHGQQQLTRSAERVRAGIAAARTRAIETGVPYQFCCEANGGYFVVAPFEPDHLSSQSNGQSNTTIPTNRLWGILPKGIVFSSEQMGLANNPASVPAGQKLAPGSLDGLPNAGDLANVSWGTPILFNPDGSAVADTVITVRDSRTQVIRLRIRGFTGAVSMSRLSTEKRS